MQITITEIELIAKSISVQSDATYLHHLPFISQQSKEGIALFFEGRDRMPCKQELLPMQMQIATLLSIPAIIVAKLDKEMQRQFAFLILFS